MHWTLLLRHRVRAVFLALPLEATAVTCAVGSFWWMVASGADHTPGRIFFSSVLAVPLFFTVTMLRRAGRVSGIAAAALAGMAALAAIAVGGFGIETEEVFAWRFGLAALAAVMAPFAVAALSARREERVVRFADFVRRFSEETTTSAVLVVAAIAAMAVVVLSMQSLFQLRLERFGVDSAGAIAGLCSLAYLHRLLGSGSPGRVPELWRRIIGRVAAPFLVAMLSILALYEATVLMRGELPVNLLSPLILAAGAVGFASTLVIESLVAVREERALSPADPHPWAGAWPVRLSRAFTAALLLLLPLACWALWVRIDQHGLTPLRVARLYGLGCLGLLAAWGAVRWVRRQRPLTWQVPVLTGAVAIAAAIGPLSVVQLSIRSQAARLDAALDREGVANRDVKTAVPAHPVPIDWARFDDMAERVQTLIELDGLGEVLTGDLAQCEFRWEHIECLERLGLSRADVPVPLPSTFLTSPTILPSGAVPGYRTINLALDRAQQDEHLGTILLSAEGRRLTVSRDGVPWVAAELVDLDRWASGEPIRGFPPLTGAAGARAYALPQSASTQKDENGSRLTYLAVTLLVPTDPGVPGPALP